MRIESLEKFGTPEEVGARVIRVEQAKDGTLDTKLLGATAEKQGELSLYTLVSVATGLPSPTPSPGTLGGGQQDCEL